MIIDDLALSHPDAEAKVWRYMDLAKFISLIDRHQLFFSSVDLFGDPYEGTLPKPNQRHASKSRSLHGKSVFVNSWHLNEYESAAMWAIYSRFNSGIAIQSTYSRLVKSFNRCEESIYIGKVNYIDYSNEWFDNDNILQPFIHKRKSFAYENELRIITIVPNRRKALGALPTEAGIGMHVSVDLNSLIEKIYVSPKAEHWLGEVVASILRNFKQSRHSVVISKLYSLA